jgi:hypothetical protein
MGIVRHFSVCVGMLLYRRVLISCTPDGRDGWKVKRAREGGKEKGKDKDKQE